jgi:hypothetical protein
VVEDLVTGHFRHDVEGRPVLDLRAEAASRQPDLSALPALDAADRDVAIRTWRGRMVNEHISTQVWAALLRQLMRAAAPPAALADVAKAASDELRHAEQCAGVVAALGGSPVALLPQLAHVPDHEDVGPLEAVLRNVISVGCMSETIAVAVIRAEHAEIEGGPLGHVLGAILADEVTHARLGWSLLGVLLPKLDADARARIEAYLVDAFAHQVRYEVPKLPVQDVASPAAARAGVCDGAFARSIFVDTVETVIVPGLERAGLRAAPAWSRAKVETARLFES